MSDRFCSRCGARCVITTLGGEYNQSTGERLEFDRIRCPKKLPFPLSVFFKHDDYDEGWCAAHPNAGYDF